MSKRLLLVLAAGLAIAACGKDEGTGPTAARPNAPPPGAGPGAADGVRPDLPDPIASMPSLGVTDRLVRTAGVTRWIGEKVPGWDVNDKTGNATYTGKAAAGRWTARYMWTVPPAEVPATGQQFDAVCSVADATFEAARARLAIQFKGMRPATQPPALEARWGAGPAGRTASFSVTIGPAPASLAGRPATITIALMGGPNVVYSYEYRAK